MACNPWISAVSHMILKPVQGRPAPVWLLSSISAVLLENPVIMVIRTTAKHLLLNYWSDTLFSKSGIYGLMVQQKADRSMVLFPTERFLISSLSSWNLRRLNRLCLNLAGSILKDISWTDQILYKLENAALSCQYMLLFWGIETRNKETTLWVFQKKSKLHTGGRRLSPSGCLLSGVPAHQGADPAAPPLASSSRAPLSLSRMMRGTEGGQVSSRCREVAFLAFWVASLSMLFLNIYYFT